MSRPQSDTISGKRVAVVTVPFTFTDKVPRELGQVSIETLRFISYLKACRNQVVFVNLRTAEKFLWKTRRAGRTSTAKIKMGVFSRSQEFLRAELSRGAVPQEILLWCDFSFFPYTFDLDVIRSVREICRDVCPGSRVRVGGVFWDIFSAQAAAEGFEVFSAGEGAADAYPPDFSVVSGGAYGLFQLAKGCSNNCSFCVAGRSCPRTFNNAGTLRYMRGLAEGGIREFWNWDQNVMLRPAHFEDFVDRYLESGLDATLHFSLGFQPNLLTARIVKKLGRLRLGTLAVPFETGTSESCRLAGKPYTIISPVKRVSEINRLAHKSIERLICPFIIGYPHDDFRSIFRIYLSILRLRSSPLPFPLCLFPNTRVYAENAGLLQGKNISELHGQLWPLVPDRKVPQYRKLLRFLAIDSLARAKDNLGLLSGEMLAAFREELRINGAFVEMCLNAGSESLAELERVEKNLFHGASRGRLARPAGERGGARSGGFSPPPGA
ncbi:MAG: hypothetical protein A2234_11305 [Elusimicrobia bacterium RIFOXYA2_FULL_58_8]|nr:MAG: hypothetical protein A2285_02845 [Elusimicrobia bacterium RIFOXYA12_FULL_57_11]OGS14526.1 MAG: hypothetical protein A2234_11305 [Elusimicrobia bacterium RIFOXYA2_FULL_58_8]